jgi:hypothetical protein
MKMNDLECELVVLRNFDPLSSVTYSVVLYIIYNIWLISVVIYFSRLSLQINCFQSVIHVNILICAKALISAEF